MEVSRGVLKSFGDFSTPGPVRKASGDSSFTDGDVCPGPWKPSGSGGSTCRSNDGMLNGTGTLDGKEALVGTGTLANTGTLAGSDLVSKASDGGPPLPVDTTVAMGTMVSGTLVAIGIMTSSVSSVAKGSGTLVAMGMMVSGESGNIGGIPVISGGSNRTDNSCIDLTVNG